MTTVLLWLALVQPVSTVGTSMTLQEQVGTVLANGARYMASRVRKIYITPASSVQPPWVINNNAGPWLVDSAYAMAVAYDAGVLANADVPAMLGAITSLAFCHAANQPTVRFCWPKQINRGRQTARLAEAARLTLPLLSAATWTLVRAAIGFEADRSKIRYLRNQFGALKTPGDSGSEEVGWSIMALGTALALLPSDRRVPAWQASFNEGLAAAYARPADVAGEPILRGSNAEQDGLIWNHNILPHVKYQRMAFSAIASTARLFDVLEIPYDVNAWFRFAAQDVYQILTTRDFGGQTIYVPGTPDIYYPAGDDANTPGNRMTFAWIDAAAARYGFDNGWLGLSFCGFHTAYAAALQARFTDGHSFAAGEFRIGSGKDNNESELAAQAAATWQLLTP